MSNETIKYKLLKDLPNAKAGTILYGDKSYVDVNDIRNETYRYHKEYVEDFDSWFKELSEG